LVGIGGALAGGLIGKYFGMNDLAAFDVRGLMMAVAGAVILLFADRCLALHATPESLP
jgi:uncharacterized membrane protein YeaQ/YmgE (transglycosylase-associated protein family)